MKAILLLALVALASCELTFHEESESMIDYINGLKTTWTAGKNPYWNDKSLSDVVRLCGALDDSHIRATMPESDIKIVDKIPENFDSRDAWPKCESIKEIRDQANCGSCWAFGAAEAMSDRLCVASDQEDQTRISSDDLTTCCGSCGFGCNGGFPASAWQYYQSSGLVTGDLYGDTKYCRPYQLHPCAHHEPSTHYPDCTGEGPTPRCLRKCQSEYEKEYSDDKHHGGSAYSVRGVEKIQSEIMTHGPVEAAFTVYSDFPTYKSGVYQAKSSQRLGGHAIKIIGWGKEDDEIPYWLVANSWNEDWGDNGLFKILRGSDECGIEDQIVAGHAPNKYNKFLKW